MILNRNCGFEGAKFKHFGAVPQYVVMDGILRWIPNPAVKQGLFGDFDPFETDLDVFTQQRNISGFNRDDPNNPPFPLPIQTTIIILEAGGGGPPQYIMDYPDIQNPNIPPPLCKRHIRDPSAKKTYGFSDNFTTRHGCCVRRHSKWSELT